MGQTPKVYVVSPKPLALADGAQRLPHVYDHVKQQLCLYYGPAREWTPDKMIADTIVPWASEWLLHYEFWLVTGIWHGGGIQPRYKDSTTDNTPPQNLWMIDNGQYLL